jgi:hypothetical protein
MGEEESVQGNRKRNLMELKEGKKRARYSRCFSIIFFYIKRNEEGKECIRRKIPLVIKQPSILSR